MSRWPIRQLKGHVVEVSQRKGETSAEVLSVTNVAGFVRSLEVFDKQVFSQDTSAYKLVSYNDLAYNPSRINVGSVARCQFKKRWGSQPDVCRRSMPFLAAAGVLAIFFEIGYRANSYSTPMRRRCSLSTSIL